MKGKAAGSAALQSYLRRTSVVSQKIGARLDADPVLGDRVALPDSDRTVVEGVEVGRHTKRRADLVLAPITAPDRAGVLELHIPAVTQLGGQIAGHGSTTPSTTASGRPPAR